MYDINKPDYIPSHPHTSTLYKNVFLNTESCESLDRSLEICQISLENINILTLNVCGLKSKMKSPDFECYISKYDLIFLMETKLDDLDQIFIDGFTLLTNNRKYKKRPSGGVAVIVKNTIVKYVEQLPLSFQDTIWVKIKKLFEKPIVMAAIYNPPENSRYADDNLFDFKEKVVLDNDDKTCSICLLGDFNARTANLPDSVQDDSFENLNNQEFVPPQRSNQDNTVNKYGHKLLDMCEHLDLYIVNGRCGDDKDVGKTTSKNISTVDYCIVTKDIFDKIEQFQVKEFDDMLSDILCPLHLSLVSYTTSEPQKNTSETVNKKNRIFRPKWKPELATQFKETLEKRKY